MNTNNVGFLMNDVIRLMRREYQKKSLSLTLMQARALYLVSRYEGIRQVALAERLEIQPISLARLVDQLVQDKLVERQADPEDRRAYRLVVTPDAAEQLACIEKVVNDVRDMAFEGLTQAEVAQLQSLLERIHTNLQDDTTS